ncbi:ATP-dependent endonuclease [Agrobacterium tumefaciens]|uniref:ATP-dependent nuclease n=1 Tax=Agrobacterium tumefaciens TaxID=358 RepID=UPI001294DC28|nr:AAA family ATPase [Agrobacterium tumefaciens]MQB35452.1 ATP-dependent endonuclease [Agrobacterium tumefaciens]
MYLERLRLERFRSFENATVRFDPYLTAIVGENNGGKSNIVDAIRLLFQPANGRREVYCEESDLRDGEASFRIKAQLTDLSPAQRGLLATAIRNPTKGEARFGLDFAQQSGDRYRAKYWCGEFEAAPEPGSTDLIKYVYLPPLRDAQRALASGNPTRIAQLLRYFLNSDKAREKQFVADLRRDLKPVESEEKESTKILGSIETAIGRLLRDLTTGAKLQKAALGFSGNESLYDIARDLRFKLGEQAIAPEEIRQSGLGYANLLFMATVIMELEQSKDADLTLFLVEEPEAHLHPQLQMLVLDFLRDKAKQSAKVQGAPGQPQGRIQVIVTSHSPNITAWTDLESIVVARAVPAPPGRPKSLTLPINALDLHPHHLAKVSRYLDVTRSALLFGGRVMLVEGIAESLLLPVFSERLFPKRHDPDHADRIRWKRFKSATLIAIDGVDFEPYVRLLLTSYLEPGGSTSIRIADKVVVVTDRDPGVPSDRIATLQRIGAALGAGTDLVVRANDLSFEQSLYSIANAPLLRAAFLDVHPQSQKRWQSEIAEKAAGEQAVGFWDLFASKTNAVRKGDYAQALATLLTPKRDEHVPKTFTDDHKDAGNDAAIAAYKAAIAAFEIPEYIRQALEDIVAGDE